MKITEDLSQLAMDAKTCDGAKAELAGVSYAMLRSTADRYRLNSGFTQPEDLLQNYFVNRFHQDVNLYDVEKGQSWKTFMFGRFKFSIADYMRRRESQPTADYVSRSGRKLSSVSTNKVLFADNHRSTIGNLLPECRRDADIEFENFCDHLKPLVRQSRLLMILKYVEGMTMLQIGKQLGLSESRVSQMHSEALKTIEKNRRR